MRRAIELSEASVAAGQTPFGAVIVREGEVLAATHNSVWRETDSTAHAEIKAIRAAEARLGRVDLAGCVLYSSCEPCPMCLAAIHWARVATVWCGARIGDARAAGFNELAIPAEEMVRLGGSSLRIGRDLLRSEAAAVLRRFGTEHPERLY
jgi:tRNA(Arg) A34 adenosine deaminase TadA